MVAGMFCSETGLELYMHRFAAFGLRYFLRYVGSIEESRDRPASIGVVFRPFAQALNPAPGTNQLLS